MMPTNDANVVIVGAGFGGLWAAEVEPELIAQPVRRIVRDEPNVRFAMLDVQRVDLERQLVCGPDQEFHYDYLILALGSVNHFFSAFATVPPCCSTGHGTTSFTSDPSASSCPKDAAPRQAAVPVDRGR
jgi:hypothetical protein